MFLKHRLLEMLYEFHCFGCKDVYEEDLTKYHTITITKNSRYVASTDCPRCHRKMTSLVPKSVFDWVKSQQEDSKVDEVQKPE